MSMTAVAYTKFDPRAVLEKKKEVGPPLTLLKLLKFEGAANKNKRGLQQV
jgi:hypothetical protein